jgi:hypothetical protein
MVVAQRILVVKKRFPVVLQTFLHMTLRSLDIADSMEESASSERRVSVGQISLEKNLHERFLIVQTKMCLSI